MAVRPEAYTNPLLDVEGDPFAGVVNPYTSVNPAAQSGMEALRPGLADQAIGLQPPTEVSRFEMPSGLSTPPSGYGLPSLGDLEALQQQTPFEFLAATQAPQPQQQEQGLRLGYDSAAGKYLINNTVVDFRDIESLQRVPELVQEPLSPETPAGNWRPIDLQTLKRNKDALLDISIGERVRLGTQQVVGSIPRGVGRVFEFAGAEGLGEAFVGLGERLSPDEFDEARQAAVQQSQNIFQEIATGVPQGLPSVVASIGGGIAGGVAGGFITGGPGGAVIGGIIGGASTIFPMMVDSAYDTALRQQGEEFVKSPEGRVQILGTALATTGVQIVPGSIVAGRVVPTLMQRAGQQVAQKSVSSIPGEAAKVGFAEGIAEMMAVVIEQVAFDPETRAMMSEGEVAAMLPYVAETYGREAAVAFSVGAILGAPIGAVTAAATRPREEVPTAPEPESNLLVPTEDRPAAPEFTGEMRGVGPQGVLPMEGLGGRIEQARRSRQVGYQPPRTGEQTNLLERPAPVVDEAQLELPLGEPAPVQQELPLPAPPPVQQELPLTAADRLRRGVQRVPDVIPPAVEPAVPAPAQGQLFTRRGLPTAAARVSITAAEPGQLFGRVDGSPFRTEVSAVGQRRRVSRDTGIPLNELEVTQTDDGFFLRRRGEEVVREPVVEDVVTGVPEDAIQEPSPAAVPARERAEVSPEVGARVPSVAEPARAREEEVIQQAQETRRQDVREDVALPPLPPSRRGADREQYWQNLAARTLGIEPDAEPAVVAPTDFTQYSTPEDAWNALSPEGAPAYNELRLAQQDAWEQAYVNNVLSEDIAQQLNQYPSLRVRMRRNENPPVPVLRVDEAGNARVETLAEVEGDSVSDVAIVDGLIDSVENTRNSTEYRDGISNLLDWAYNITPAQQEAGLGTKIFEFLDTIPIDATTQYAVIDFARAQGAPLKATDADGNLTPVFQYILKADIFESVRKRFGFENLPGQYQPTPEEVVLNVETNQQVPNDKAEIKAESLANLIRDYNTREFAMNANDRQLAIEKLAKQYQAVQAEGLESFTDTYGEPLSNYFDEDGAPNAVVRDNRLRIVTDQTAERSRITTPDMLEQWDVDAVTGEATVRPADRLRRRTEGTEEEALLRSMGMDGRLMTLDGEPISKPMGEKQVRMFLNTFKNKLKIKPRTFVYKNQADLQSRNPELYQRAVAARPQGDFDTKVAAGYSFGTGKDATVVIFSDRIVTRQQLNFVMAHETLGHFGFRALLPKGSVDSFMEAIYRENGPESALVQEVDADMAANPSLSRAEAVEEYLADFAAQIDVSLISRVFNFIKSALNRLGVQFSDDAARYLVNQSRRYVRNGATNNLFVNSEVMRRIQELENGSDPENTGRFAPKTTLRLASTMGSLMTDGYTMSVESAQKFFKDQNVDLSGSFDKFKNTFFSLFIFRARENEGLSQLHDVLQLSREKASATRRKYQEKMKVVLDRAIIDKLSNVGLLGGTTKAEINEVNRFLFSGNNYAENKLKTSDLGSDRLFNIDANGNPIRNNAEVERLLALGTLRFEQMRDGFSYENTYLEEGETKTETVNIKGIEGLTEDSPIWRGYLATKETMADVELDLLEAKIVAYQQDRDFSYKEISFIMQDDNMTPEARRFLDRMYNKYKQLWTQDQVLDENGDLRYNQESIDRADKFIKALNTAIIATEPSATDPIAAERNAAVAEFFPNVPPGDINVAIETFKPVLKPRSEMKVDDQYTIQNKMKQIITSDLLDNQYELGVKTSIANGYIPVIRRGNIELSILAYDEDGNRLALRQEYRNQLVYRQFGKESEALNIAERMNKELFGKNFYKVEAYDQELGDFKLQNVELRAEVSEVLDSIAAPPQTNLAEFTEGLRRFNIILPPKKLEQVIEDLTTQNNNARRRLRRQGVPGATEFDPETGKMAEQADALRNVAEHIEQRASTISKVVMRPKLAELTNRRLESTRKLWDGDKAKLDRLRAERDAVLSDPGSSDGEKLYARKQFNRYNYMYTKTNPPGKAKRGKLYFNEGSRLLRFIENNEDLNESDFGRGKIPSAVSALTSIMFLGGSIATGALNYISIPTNVLPYLATYNENNDYGGGFGMANASQAVFTALDQIGLRRSVTNTKLNYAEFYDEMADNKSLRDQYDLKDHEARFMAREIREGTMQPAQINMLTELMLGRIKSAALRRTIEGYMWTFAATERGSRRGVGLGAYRLEYQRRIESGFSKAQASEFASKFAADTINMTLGNYSVTNRPSAWRQGVQSFVFMYKIFPTTSIQSLARLPRSGQIQMIAMLTLLSGVSGLPFAEDLEDIIDTISQRLGIGKGSIRAEVANISNAILPGSSPFLLTGLFRSIFPGDPASRTSLGNMIPGTGSFLHGANTGREVAEIAGPAYSMISGVGTFINNAYKAATTEQVTLEDVLRESPVTTMRMLGDVSSYIQSGAVVDRRGYVVSPDMHMGILVARLMGFYPSSAAEAYSIIRVSKRIADYERDVAAGFRYGWIKAKLRGDDEQARAIARAAKEYGITDFVKNSNKALKEARKPALERLRSSTPTRLKEDIDRVADTLGY